jgi:hypothetical protein
VDVLVRAPLGCCWERRTSIRVSRWWGTSSYFLVLLGIVFAGFTLVVSLLSDDYLRWLSTSPDGPRGFLAPFVIAVGVQVFTLLLAIVYRAIATDLSSSYEKTLFVLIGFFTTFAALEVVALARNVFAHGLTRARGIEVSDLQDKRSQRASKG